MPDQFKRGEAVPYFIAWVENSGLGMFITDDGSYDLHIAAQGEDDLTVTACNIYEDPIASACIPYRLLNNCQYPIDVLCLVEESLYDALMDSVRLGGRRITVTK